MRVQRHASRRTLHAADTPRAPSTRGSVAHVESRRCTRPEALCRPGRGLPSPAPQSIGSSTPSAIVSGSSSLPSGEGLPGAHTTPPGMHSLRARGLDRLPEPRHDQMRPPLRRELHELLGRLVPRVYREVERAPVDGEKGAAAEQREGIEGVLRAQVNIPPRRVIRADFEHHQVERAESLRDLGVLRRQAGVAAEEDRVLRASHDERRPERRIPAPDGATREVLRRRRGNAHPAARKVEALPPIELRDPLCGDAPRLEVRAHAEGRHDGHIELCDLEDRRVVEVIVVVVRDDDGVERRERRHGHRDGLKALRAGEGDRRRTLSPHRIGQDADAVDLEQHRRVAEPGRPEARLGGLGPVGQRVHRREGRGRGPPLAAEEELTQRRKSSPLLQTGCGRVGVLETAVDEMRRRFDALEARPDDLPTKRGHVPSDDGNLPSVSTAT